MKPIGPTIRKYLKDSQIKIAKVAEDMGMSSSQLSTLLAKSSWDAEKLEKVCQITGLSPMTFFELEDEGKVVVYSDIKDVNASSNFGNTAVNLGSSAAERIIDEKDKLLEEKDRRLEDKEKLLQEKERTIKMLMRQAGLEDGA